MIQRGSIAVSYALAVCTLHRPHRGCGIEVVGLSSLGYSSVRILHWLTWLCIRLRARLRMCLGVPLRRVRIARETRP